MSVHMLETVMTTGFDNAQHKAMLSQMAFEADEEGVCRSDIPGIAERCNLDLTKTFKCIQELNEAGYIDIDNSNRNLEFILNPENIVNQEAHH